MTASLFPEPIYFPLEGHEPFLGAVRQDMRSHRDQFGERMSAAGVHGDALIDRFQAAELTGRGGAHFSVATKWRSVRASSGSSVVVVNGAESEPASVKDAALLQLRPHLVLDGVSAAAEAAAAGDVIVWLHEGNRASRKSLDLALTERRQAGVVDPHIRIAFGPDRYLSGESSTIINALSGGPALPVFRRTPASREGVQGRPTLLHNVETFARIGALARVHQPLTEPGTMLTVVSSRGRTVVDVSPHLTLGAAVEHATSGGQPSNTIQAALVGGYGGQWISWREARTLPLSEPVARSQGRSLGAGVVAVLPFSSCGVWETARILNYLAESSARQCGPCLFGLAELAGLMSRIADGSSRRGDLKRLNRFSEQVLGRGGCHHPDGAVRMLASSLEVFASDIHSHAKKKHCRHASSPPFLPIPAAA